MREIRKSGSEGGAAQSNAPSLPLSWLRRSIPAKALFFLRTNRSAEVLPFTDQLVPVELNPRDTVMTNAAKLAALPPGATDCSVPLAEMNRRKAQGIS